MKPPADPEANGEPSTHPPQSATEDAEVAAWVKDRLERRQRGQLGEPQKPALHTVALDVVDPSTISPK